MIDLNVFQNFEPSLKSRPEILFCQVFSLCRLISRLIVAFSWFHKVFIAGSLVLVYCLYILLFSRIRSRIFLGRGGLSVRIRIRGVDEEEACCIVVVR